MRLDRFDAGDWERGHSRWLEGFWLLLQALLVSSWVPGSAHRAWLLRRFGARIGRGSVLKPGLKVKFPWRLVMGDHVWLGERVWIDNLATVRIGSHCCVSQDAYLCTGSHDWASERFDLVVRPIEIQDHSWICARAVVGPGIVVGEGAVLSLGSVATRDLEAWTIWSGVPAEAVRKRPRPQAAQHLEAPGQADRGA